MTHLRRGPLHPLAWTLLCLTACGEELPVEPPGPEETRFSQATLFDTTVPTPYPSALDLQRGQPRELATEVGPGSGDFYLEAQGDGTLQFKSLHLFAPSAGLRRTGIQQLRGVEFEGLREVPATGYTDSLGVVVVQQGVYALVTQENNFAKLRVDTVATVPDSIAPRGQMVTIRVAFQNQRGNRTFAPDTTGSD